LEKGDMLSVAPGDDRHYLVGHISGEIKRTLKSHVLTEAELYEAADLPLNAVPIHQILSVSFSVQQFRDLALLSKSTNLRIVIFRLCGLVSIPNELFDLPTIENIDLTGNYISTFSDASKFRLFPNLVALNLSDNRISDINEAFLYGSSRSLGSLI
jgi:hypothetical protein